MSLTENVPKYLVLLELTYFPGGDEHKKVDIPAVWYPDRYLKSGREAALEMRIQKKNIMDKLTRISWTENRLTHCPLTAGRVVKVKDLFDATLRHDEARIENGINSEEDLMEADIQPSRAALKLSEELMKVMASIDKKLLGKLDHAPQFFPRP